MFDLISCLEKNQFTPFPKCYIWKKSKVESTNVIIETITWLNVYNHNKVYFGILKDEFKILTGRTFSRNKMARKLSVFSSLMSNYSFNNNFCQKIIIYLESLYNKLYFGIKFISEYWKMNSKSWQDGLFHGTKWRENYQCSRLWCQIILLIIISV